MRIKISRKEGCFKDKASLGRESDELMGIFGSILVKSQ